MCDDRSSKSIFFVKQSHTNLLLKYHEYFTPSTKYVSIEKAMQISIIYMYLDALLDNSQGTLCLTDGFII
ncbi:hypothetical protein SS1G_11451 [Sclerotinia sclerotiorum 1980 UF-70]|uniref:Uncharacterized protein n=1 Tax=Sclerotinia sclerotiorum (strain ATCC 18683 / 1980 / Ss-1) TaxID=665079 RepID=A7F1I1_SCLS1|nr:hypothetical protein SS1G_11451 [Sclerotinia sclerotiorum 1980 UF-70]EDN95573.1 hypothetical protein SS1G_11451 [Sclerotinia sclerotiorum 1980 UF-70]